MSVTSTAARPIPPRTAVSRRWLLGSAMRVAASFFLLSLSPVRAFAEALEEAFKQRTLPDVLKMLGEQPQPSDQVTLTTPDIAENGAVVPISIRSTLPSTTQIYIIVEKNPNPLAAVFTIADQTEPAIGARVKVAQTSNVIAVVKAGGKLYSATRETKVTLGGCGG